MTLRWKWRCKFCESLQVIVNDDSYEKSHFIFERVTDVLGKVQLGTGKIQICTMNYTNRSVKLGFIHYYYTRRLHVRCSFSVNIARNAGTTTGSAESNVLSAIRLSETVSTAAPVRCNYHWPLSSAITASPDRSRRDVNV